MARSLTHCHSDSLPPLRVVKIPSRRLSTFLYVTCTSSPIQSDYVVQWSKREEQGRREPTIKANSHLSSIATLYTSPLKRKPSLTNRQRNLLPRPLLSHTTTGSFSLSLSWYFLFLASPPVETPVCFSLSSCFFIG